MYVWQVQKALQRATFMHLGLNAYRLLKVKKVMVSMCFYVGLNMVQHAICLFCRAVSPLWSSDGAKAGTGAMSASPSSTSYAELVMSRKEAAYMKPVNNLSRAWDILVPDEALLLFRDSFCQTPTATKVFRRDSMQHNICDINLCSGVQSKRPLTNSDKEVCCGLHLQFVAWNQIQLSPGRLKISVLHATCYGPALLCGNQSPAESL